MNFQKATKTALIMISTTFALLQISCQRIGLNQFDAMTTPHSENPQDDSEGEDGYVDPSANCVRANSRQIAQVNLGNDKLKDFLEACRAKTASSPWCDQVARPNPDSHLTFDCTYSVDQPHLLIHPTIGTWGNAIEAVKIVEDLEKQKVKVCSIYNWWRPEPYNQNVGGAPGRHPYGTSVDVRFCSKADQLLAHKLLCKMRKQGRLRALGYYSSTALHLGVGDSVANTWGKSCP